MENFITYDFGESQVKALKMSLLTQADIISVLTADAVSGKLSKLDLTLNSNDAYDIVYRYAGDTSDVTLTEGMYLVIGPKTGTTVMEGKDFEDLYVEHIEIPVDPTVPSTPITPAPEIPADRQIERLNALIAKIKADNGIVDPEPEPPVDLTPYEKEIADLKIKVEELTAAMLQASKTDVMPVTEIQSSIANSSKDLVVKFEEPITSTTVITGKTVEVQKMSTSSARVALNAENLVYVSNFSSTGELPKAVSNASFSINNTGDIFIKDSNIGQSGYNAVEIGLDNTRLPKNVTIENVNFTGKMSNNAILVFGNADESVITVRNCVFEDCSNPIRLSNRTNKKVTLNIVDCTFKKWEANADYAGMILCQDYTSGTAEKEAENNLFAPEKITINIENCTGPYGKIEAGNMAEMCGSKIIDKQIIYVYANKSGLQAYDAARFPQINIK